MKDTDRPAAVPLLASIPVWEVPVVAMATHVDPILMAIERDRIARDRIAYVAFAGSLNRTAEGKQHRRKVVTSHNTDGDAHEAASAGRGECIGG
jgi:hypothetical protein